MAIFSRRYLGFEYPEFPSHNVFFVPQNEMARHSLLSYSIRNHVLLFLFFLLFLCEWTILQIVPRLPREDYSPYGLIETKVTRKASFHVLDGSISTCAE